MFALRLLKISLSCLLLFLNAKANISNIKSCTFSLVVTSSEVQDFESFFYKNTSKVGISYGTAFYYYNEAKKQNYILTNFHVIEKAFKKNIQIVGCNDKLECEQFEVVSIDKKFDLAILQPIQKIEGNKNCGFIISNDFKESDKILIYGNKLGMGNSFSYGIVSKIDSKLENDGEESIVNFFDVNAGYGNSGGAIFLENSNKIVGILTTIYSSNNSSAIVFGITPANILTSIKRMNEMLEIEKIIEFNIIEKDNNIYFEMNNENIFFQKINIKNTDQIQTIGRKPISNKIEAVYEIYNFIDGDAEEIPIAVITADKRLRSVRLKKYRSNTDFSI